MNPRYLPVWEMARPYLQTRQNDKHTLYCYYFAEQLLHIYGEADAEIVLPAMLLHDVGWSTVPEDKQLLSFGPRMRYPELQRQHETEGVRIATKILTELNYDTAVIDAMAEIIDGHDTRAATLSLNDSLVRDADKLWRYTSFGLETLSEWFGYTVAEQMDVLEKWIGYRFYTAAGAHMARGLLGALWLQVDGVA